MSPDERRIVLEPQPERRPASLAALLAAGMALVVAMGLLGSVGSPVEAPSDSLPEVTAPRQQPLAIMPEVTGKYLIEVVDLLRDSGLDSIVVSRARWVANPQVGSGVVSSQRPEPGSDVFDINEVDLVISAGGPVISWGEVPMDLQDLVATNYTPDRTEPILIVETSAGRVYKTDTLLFGTCEGVALVRDTFFDRSFDGLCHQSPPATIVGWTPNGAMYAIEGLPSQGRKSSSTLLKLDARFWDIQSVGGSVRRVPAVTVEANGIRIVGGYDEYFVWTTGQPELTDRIAELIEPIDIRGSLVLNLTAPLAFELNFGGAIVRYDNADVISSAAGSSVIISPAFADAAQATALAPTRWKRVNSGDTEWQHAVPELWQSLELSEFELVSATTFIPSGPPDLCGFYPLGLLRQVGPADAVVYVTHGNSVDFKVWVAHFDTDDVGPVSALDPDFDCLADLDLEVRTSSRFYDGKSLDIVIGFGPDTEAATRRQAFAILDSLERLPVYDPGQ